MGTPLRALIIEDSPDDAELMQIELCSSGFEVTSKRVDTRKTLNKALREQSWDVVLSDHSLPSFNSQDALKIIKKSKIDIPFIIVSGAIGEEQAVAAMRAGCHDYVMKQNLHRLGPVVERALRDAEARRERRRAAEALQQTTNTLNSILTSATEYAIVATNLEFDIIHYNPAAERIFGYKAEEVIGHTVRKLPAHDSVPSLDFEQAVETALREGKKENDCRINGPNGEVRFVHWVVMPMRDQAGECIGFVFFASDVTEHRKMEEDLRESEARFRQLFDEAPVGYHELDTEGRITRVNRTELEMLGYTLEELLGRPAWEFQVDQESAQQVIMDKLAGQMSPTRALERTYRRKDGSTLPVLIESRLLRDGQEWITGLRSTMEDITERKRAEEDHKQLEAQLQQSQRLHSLGVLAGGIAHDFNNLLTIISNNADFLHQSLPLDEVAGSALKDIEVAARHAGDMTHALQAFSRPTKPQIRHVDANALIEEVCRFLRRAMPATIDFRIDPDPSPCTIAVDPGQMQQIIVNLFLNARDAMPTGGMLEIRTRCVGPEALPVHGKHEPVSDQYVQIRVCDTGCGMDAETLRQVFDPFFTTKPKDRGTGLGLAIVYKIVETHNGVIDVHSEPGKGTQFDIFFPMVEPAPAEESSQLLPMSQGEERILVVDDEEMIGSLLKTVLDSRGYKTTVAHNPQEAIASARMAKQPFNLAIIDYSMPGMNGAQCLAELRSTHPDLKAILITGYSEEEQDISAQGCKVIYKPFTVPIITQTVRSTLDGQ